MNLLVVDDSSYIRENLKALTKASNEFNYFEASNGETALNILKTESIDILLVDTVLVDMSASELTKKALLVKANLKVFGLSTQDKGLTHTKILSSGALKVFKKPITLSLLKNAIQEYDS